MVAVLHLLFASALVGAADPGSDVVTRSADQLKGKDMSPSGLVRENLPPLPASEVVTLSDDQLKGNDVPQSALVREALHPLPLSRFVSVSPLGAVAPLGDEEAANMVKSPQVHRSRVREEAKVQPAGRQGHHAGAKRHTNFVVDSTGEVESLPDESEGMASAVTLGAHRENLHAGDAAGGVQEESADASVLESDRRSAASFASSSDGPGVRQSGPGARCTLPHSLVAASSESDAGGQKLSSNTTLDGLGVCAGSELEHGASCRPICSTDFAFVPSLKNVGCGPSVQSVLCSDGKLSAASSKCACAELFSARHASDFWQWASGWVGSGSTTNLHLAR